MKKVFGVMILAGLPVACGTTLPSAPEATQVDDAAQTVVAKDTDEPVQLVPAPEATCAPVDTENVVNSIKLVVLERGKGWVRIGAKLDLEVDPASGSRSCFLIGWAAGPDAPRHVLEPSSSTQAASLWSAPGARITIKATIAQRRGSVIGERVFVLQ
jgi:hypothetical protein